MTLSLGEASGTLEDDIKQEARRLGFVLAGFASPDPPPHAAFFESWLGRGQHGNMGYLASERSRLCRGNPREIMPECRSILMLAMPYCNPGKARLAGSLTGVTDSRGRIAAYAWGRDYHEVIPERLRKLLEFIERRAARRVASRCYTDTGPILERDLAQRAGLGWIGKNTCLINPHLGSYFLLAEILLDLVLHFDAAVETDHCGSCTRCLESCPTHCILPDRTLDATRCISYLTIELKDAIPLEMRPQMGPWVFGCDVCQMVCPWNRFAPPEGDPALTGHASAGAPDLVEQLELASAEFAMQAKGSPLKRAKYRGYLRNTAVAAGNIAGEEAIRPLQHLARHGDGLVQEHASWAIGRIEGRNNGNA